MNVEYWRTLPRRSTTLFLAAVCCLFASHGFIFGMIWFENPNIFANACFAVLNGVCAAGWAFVTTRRQVNTMAVLSLIQISANIFLANRFTKTAVERLSDVALRHYAVINASAAVGLIVMAYGLFLMFLRREAGRYYATLTEMRLAGEIHRNLVPEIAMEDSGFEFYGRSWPSGEVSGDLVDVIRDGSGWFAYVADVSGHGVPAGVLMTMVKSAVRTRLASVGPSGFLAAMNEVLSPLSQPNMYVTLAFLSYSAGRLEFGTAAHLPVLHYRRASGEVEERSTSNFPIALLDNVVFEVSQISGEPGDVFVILTDGLSEIVDSDDNDLGLEPLKTVLVENASESLPEIAAHLRRRTLLHGKQVDDQTLLLLRCGANR